MRLLPVLKWGPKKSLEGRIRTARNVFKSSPYKGCDLNADLGSTKGGMLKRIFSWNSLLYKNIRLQHVFVLVLNVAQQWLQACLIKQ